MTPKEVVSLFVKSTNEQDWSIVSELLAPDLTRHSSTFGQPDVRTKEDLIRFHKQELETFPDLKEEIRFMVCENDMVAVRINFKGTQNGKMGPYPPSGRVLDADFNCFFRIENEKIAEAWVEYDTLNGLIQLGHFEPK